MLLTYLETFDHWVPFFNCYFLIRDATNQTVEKVGKRSTISFAVAKERISIID